MHIDFQKYGINAPAGRRGKLKMVCPECQKSDRTHKNDKSLSVDLDKGLFHCHYCGFSGCAMELDDSDKEEWKRTHAKAPKAAPKPIQTKGRDKLSARLSEWLSSRGISPETAFIFGITEGQEFMPQDGRKRNTIQFNYILNGETVNTKFRTGDKHFKLVQGAPLLPYNIDSIRDEKTCAVCEGEMDALSIYECGIHAVVSVPNGANNNLTWLDDYQKEFFDDKETIYIASDNDAKGLILRDELLRRFGPERCRLVEYADGCKDANEHLIMHGAQSLKECFKNAREPKIEGVFALKDFESELDALYQNGLKKGLTIGHQNFDELISFETKRLCILTGIPGSGKSEFLDEIATRMNIRYGWRFAFFSPENQPRQYHASKLIAKLTGEQFGKATLPINDYEEAKAHVEDNFFFIDPGDNYKLDTILEKAKSLVRRKGIKGLVIDPYNRLDPEEARTSETHVISAQLDKLTNFAIRNDVLVFLMAHPTKPTRDKEGKPLPPTLYDIAGSANFYNKADFGIIIHRNKIDDYVTVKVDKVKFRHLGEGGECYFRYNRKNGRYIPTELDFNASPAAVEEDNSNLLKTSKSDRLSSLRQFSMDFDCVQIDGDNVPNDPAANLDFYSTDAGECPF